MHESTGFSRIFPHPMSNSQPSFLLNPCDSLICDIKHSILATNQKSVRTHKLRAQQRKLANQSFPMKTQGPDRRCGIPGLKSRIQQAHKHTLMTVTHKTWPVTILFANDDEAAQQPGWNFDHKRSPHLSHELHKHANHFTAKLFIAKNTFMCAVPQNGQKCVPNTGAMRKDLPSDKYRRSRS